MFSHDETFLNIVLYCRQK